MHKRILLFDFDGVIVNTFAVCFEISGKFHSSLSEDEYRKWFEGNIHDRPRREDTKPSDGARYFDLYNPRVLALAPMEGIKEVLKLLHQKYLLVIVSSTINSPIETYLAKHNLAQYFDKVFGADVHKGKIEKIKMVFAEYGVVAADCLFITDTLGDMREAEKTGVDALGVSWGYHPSETLRRGNPIAIAHMPSDIVSEIHHYFQNKRFDVRGAVK